MQKRKTMAKIFKFVCAIILFLSLFIDAARYNPKLQNPKLRKSLFHPFFKFSYLLATQYFTRFSNIILFSICLCNDSTSFIISGLSVCPTFAGM
ncbi:unnamed protein product [Trifolium pratense]|uniref:Uncharacterized protein n=1 Tax=Trifolium pratense TaxID=57577 RepID=A0ACB0LJ46_TRIPR|nr:unnamed protein product [Trifolium pratense]